MDIGFKDLTGVVFLYYDFSKDKLVFEDEIVLQGKDFHLSKLAHDIVNKEAALWKDTITGEAIKPLARASDINYIVTQEMARATNYKLNFTPAKKDDRNAAVNQLRELLASGRIIVHPRCINLIRHLKNCKWQSSSDKGKFARSPDDGHYDLVDASIYSIREVNFNRNPYPRGFGVSQTVLNQFNWPNGQPSTTRPQEHPADVYRRIFGRKR